MVNKALASKFCGEVSNPTETCSKDAGSYVSVLPNCMGSRLSLWCILCGAHYALTWWRLVRRRVTKVLPKLGVVGQCPAKTEDKVAHVALT